MRRARLPGAALAGALLVAACTAGGGGGGYGGAPAASPATSSGVAAPPPSAAGGGYGGTKGDYATGSPATGSPATGGTKGDYATSSPTTGGSVAPGTVRLSGLAFDPVTMSTATGASLTFVNEDGVAHDIVEGSDGTAVATPAVHVRLGPGATSSVTLSKAGSYTLTCTIHPSMAMTLTVGP